VEQVALKWFEVERSGTKWNEVERSGTKWNEVERSGAQVVLSGLKRFEVEQVAPKWHQVAPKWHQVVFLMDVGLSRNQRLISRSTRK
jgi:hypothetical protein